MPVPRPAKDEDKSKFMSRCVGFMHGENNKKADKDKWTNEQMVAICFSQWERKGKMPSKAAVTTEEKETDEQFVARFLKKHPEYKRYFEQESLDPTTET